MGKPNCLATKIPRSHSTGYFLSGFFQRQSLLREICNVDNFSASITSPVATVTTEVLQRTWLELLAGYLRATMGAHVEGH